MEPQAPILIPARSKREAMDWGLVLHSQEIETTISHEEGVWGVLVEEPDFERSQALLRQWEAENRGWKWRRKLPGSKVLFHWGSVLWTLAIAAFYFRSLNPGVKDAGVMDSHLVRAGEWWRLFTAVTLHADIPHLVSNSMAGGLLLGLAMARFGAGVALLAAFLAGVLGNVAGLAFYGEAHRGLGASGMVMGALGLISVQSIAVWSRSRSAKDGIARALAASVLIFVLMGFAPESDVVAHAGGFVGGAVFGFALSWMRLTEVQKAVLDKACVVVLMGVVFLTWHLALR